MTRNLIIAGGPAHPFDATAPRLAAILKQNDIDSDITLDIEDGLSRLGDYDMLTVHCLRWSMTQDPKYAPLKEQFALSLSQKGRDAVMAHVGKGKPLFAVHTAPISFDDWPQWGPLIGATWVWGSSGHPPLGTTHVAEPDQSNEITKGLPAFDITDELYSNQIIAPDARVLMTATTEGGSGPQPILLTREQGGARIVYSALGHDERSFDHPVHQQLLGRIAGWLTRR